MKRLIFVLTCFVFYGGMSSDLFAQRLFLLSAGCFKDEMIGADARNGADRWTSIFVENLPTDRLVIYNDDRSRSDDESKNADSVRWTGPDLAASDQLESDLPLAINNCPAGADDAILVFWFGTARVRQGESTLVLSSDSRKPGLSRSELVSALRRKKTRFAGLLTESGLRWNRRAVRLPKRDVLGPGESLMESLFFQSRGFLDVNSSERKQVASVLPTFGGAMVAAFDAVVARGGGASDWETTLADMDHYMADSLKLKQRLDIHSFPPSTVKAFPVANDVAEEETPSAAQTNRSDRFGRRLDIDWNGYAGEYREAESLRAEPYPDNYADFAAFSRVWDDGATGIVRGWPGGGAWSAPIYHPERGDLLLGINGRRIYNYDDFLQAIRYSPSVIYLTFADRSYGYLYELRTLLGPPNRAGLRLGLYVVNDLFGGVRVRGSVLASPASRCQYRLGYRFSGGIGFSPERDVPPPRPIPEPIPGPIPGPIPEPIPGPIPGPIPEPIPEPIPGPIPEPIPEPIPGPIPGPIPEPIPEPIPSSQT